MQICKCCHKGFENLVHTNCVLGEYTLCASCSLKLNRLLKDYVIDKSELNEADLEEMNFCGGWNIQEHEIKTSDRILFIKVTLKAPPSYENTLHFCESCFLEYLQEFGNNL